MLINNPVTRFLYKFGYLGVQDIDEYWHKYEDAITAAYIAGCKGRDAQEDLCAFRLKVRWASYYGYSIRMVIQTMLRTQTDQTLDFKAINGMFRDPTMGIDHFTEMTLEASDRTYENCLQGISIINRKVQGVTFENVDFSYAALDGTVFNGVQFINCKFHKTSFRDVKLRDCTFDAFCVLSYNDFRQTLIDAAFDCNIVEPLICTPNWLGRLRGPENPEKKYLDYTRVVNPSFNENMTRR